MACMCVCLSFAIENCTGSSFYALPTTIGQKELGHALKIQQTYANASHRACCSCAIYMRLAFKS